ncbi:hypothetical protein [Bradyrhizobium sp. ERR14]|uniref:hypothetical protein n=1 Tax=Bradyrhizobium sp. ERR14 TaxID=2663837 RepID=UPI001612C418|nr:hypothetical protein [Bradyrhizobium sp. ERR14]MBB4398710.1 hypothetical protein [Bradyrhizobium sp. ERR14]
MKNLFLILAVIFASTAANAAPAWDAIGSPHMLAPKLDDDAPRSGTIITRKLTIRDGKVIKSKVIKIERTNDVDAARRRLGIK